jgi:hypothetical protein
MLQTIQSSRLRISNAASQHLTVRFDRFEHILIFSNVDRRDRNLVPPK